MRKYVVKAAWDDSVLTIESLSKVNSRVIAECPKDANKNYITDIDSIQIDDVEEMTDVPRQSVDGNGDPVFQTVQQAIYDSEGVPTGETEEVQVAVHETDGEGNIIYDQVGTGSFQKVASIIQSKWDEHLVHKEMEEEEEKVAAEFSGMDVFQHDIQNQTKALIEYNEGDSTRFDTVAKALRYADYSEYMQEGLVASKKYCCIVNNSGTLAIVEADYGTKPSNFKRMAPRGFKPGDEEFLTLEQDGSISIDWDGRLLKFNSLEKSADVQRERDAWNQKSPIQRVKDAVFSSE